MADASGMDGADSGQRVPAARRFRKRWAALALLLAWLGVGCWHTLKPMPPGTGLVSPPVATAAREVEFIADLTYRGPRGEVVHEQGIFDEVARIIDQSRSFVIADFFLFNDVMGAAGGVHRALSRELADRLIARKAAQPSLAILLITDPINETYGGAPSPLLDELRAAGIDVVITDLRRLRDSNPLYSAGWRLFVQWFGNSPAGGIMRNPFTDGGERITLRSWLSLLNFKANHRKLVAADRADASLVGLITSANPHDASSAHSNVALRFSGDVVRHLIASELAIARFSGWDGRIELPATPAPAGRDAGDTVHLSFHAEQGIRSHLLGEIDACRAGDSIRMAMFYLADRGIIHALLAAAARGVRVRLVLDPNKDAFGRRKDGVPNRPVAHELVSRSDGAIAVRWYRTHGEQFHTKLALIRRGQRLIASLGSANLTRRNIAGYNLEANIAVDAPASSAPARAMDAYFERLWTNPQAPAVQFTAPFAAYRDDSRIRYWRYRLMEATGLSTF